MADVATEKKENVKVVKLKEYFQENKMEMFAEQNLEDEANTTIFRSKMQVKGQLLPFAILIDNTIYNLVQVQLAPTIVNAETFSNITKFLNTYNNKFRFFKFTISEAGDLLINATITFTEENFQPALLNAILAEIIKFLETEYGNIMEKVWSEIK